MYSKTTTTSAQRQQAFCKHCKKLVTHCEAWCNKNPSGRFYGKSIDQIYTKPKTSDFVSARTYKGSRPVSSARRDGGTSSFAASPATSARTKALPSMPQDRKLSDYENGYSAGFAAGFAAAKTAIANGQDVTQPNQIKSDKCLKELDSTSSCRLPEPAPASEADVAKKWDDFGQAESARLASFKTPESYEKQKAYFADVLAKEKANPTPVAYKEKFTETFGWKGDVGGPRDRKAPQPIALPWNPAALPNATNPAANGPPPRRSAVPPHLRTAGR